MAEMAISWSWCFVVMFLHPFSVTTLGLYKFVMILWSMNFSSILVLVCHLLGIIVIKNNWSSLCALITTSGRFLYKSTTYSLTSISFYQTHTSDLPLPPWVWRGGVKAHLPMNCLGPYTMPLSIYSTQVWGSNHPGIEVSYRESTLVDQPLSSFFC
jgi:hypothetical protein